jgi:hypothetical protein
MIRRNVAGQVIYLPQLTTTDGTPITSSATLTVAKDGSEAGSGGTLAHVSNGVWKYTPTQAETDAAIVGLILTGTNAVPVVLNLVTTAADTSAVALGANTTTPTNLSAAQVRTELATELARIDVAISTRSAFNAASDTVTVGTNNDKTGYALTQAFPSNFASLGINSDGHISRVVLVDTTTANTDMRGTDNALLASSYTTPANGDIAAIKAKTDNLPNDPATLAKQDEILGAIGDIECGGGGGLTGDYTLTVTVTDADTSQPIENATVTLSRTGERGAELTDVNGVAVLGLDAATWSWIVRAAGYESRTGTVVVSGDQALSVEMDGIVQPEPPEPAEAPLCAVTLPVINQYGVRLSGVSVGFKFAGLQPNADPGAVIMSPPPPQVSDGNGVVQVNLIRLARYTATYKIEGETRNIAIAVPDEGSFIVVDT